MRRTKAAQAERREYWRKLIARQEQSEQPVRMFCKEHPGGREFVLRLAPSTGASIWHREPTDGLAFVDPAGADHARSTGETLELTLATGERLRIARKPTSPPPSSKPSPGHLTRRIHGPAQSKTRKPHHEQRTTTRNTTQCRAASGGTRTGGRHHGGTEEKRVWRQVSDSISMATSSLRSLAGRSRAHRHSYSNRSEGRDISPSRARRSSGPSVYGRSHRSPD